MKNLDSTFQIIRTSVGIQPIYLLMACLKVGLRRLLEKNRSAMLRVTVFVLYIKVLLRCLFYTISIKGHKDRSTIAVNFIEFKFLPPGKINMIHWFITSFMFMKEMVTAT